MDINMVIAENLRRLRMERNYSLGQLSQICEVSKVMLSQIEKGETNPTINTIWKIANGLKVPYTSLLEEQKKDTKVIRKSQIKEQNSEDGTYRIYCYYTNTPSRNLEMYQMELDPGCSYTSIGHSEKSEEYIMVIEGELLVEVHQNTYSLNADESINFIASQTHKYINKGEKTVKAVAINYYPS